MKEGFYLDPLGEFYSAKAVQRNKQLFIKPLKKRSFLSTREQLSLHTMGITVALRSYFFTTDTEELTTHQAFEVLQGTALTEKSDLEWLYSVIGTNVKAIMPDYQAIANLFTTSQDESEAVLVYCDGPTCKILLIRESIVQAQFSFATREFESVGLHALLQRINETIKEATLPEKVYLIGHMSARKEFGTHLWEEQEISYLKAAGAGIPCKKTQLLKKHKNRNIVRYIRRLFYSVAILLLLFTATTTYQLQKKITNYKRTYQEDPLFSTNEKKQIHALKEKKSALQSEIQRKKQYHQWEHFLTLLGQEAKKHSILIERFASRKSKGNRIEIQLRGSGKKEKQIQQFIQKLEESSFVEKGTLKQLDKRNKRYEFSLLCLTNL